MRPLAADATLLHDPLYLRIRRPAALDAMRAAQKAIASRGFRLSFGGLTSRFAGAFNEVRRCHEQVDALCSGPGCAVPARKIAQECGALIRAAFQSLDTTFVNFRDFQQMPGSSCNIANFTSQTLDRLSERFVTLRKFFQSLVYGHRIFPVTA